MTGHPAGRPFLVALAVLNDTTWKKFATENDLAANRPNGRVSGEKILSRITARLAQFPRFAQVRAVHATLKPWTIEAGLLTPTLKVKRDTLQALLAREINALYAAKRASSRPEVVQ